MELVLGGQASTIRSVDVLFDKNLVGRSPFIDFIHNVLVRHGQAANNLNTVEAIGKDEDTLARMGISCTDDKTSRNAVAVREADATDFINGRNAAIKFWGLESLVNRISVGRSTIVE